MNAFEKLAMHAQNPDLFPWGMGFVYITAFILLGAVFYKFMEHRQHPQRLKRAEKNPYSTLEMTISVAMLFPFWIRSFTQIQMPLLWQSIYFGTGLFMILFGVVWHLWAKINIGFMWSNGIEIKKEHRLMTAGAFALARHPMYASLLMWCWGASLMMMNLATLLGTTFIILPLMIKRASDEEKQLAQIFPEYVIYQSNVHMLFPKTAGVLAMMLRVVTLLGLAYCVWVGLTFYMLVWQAFVFFYLGYASFPNKVAFSFRTKSVLMIVFWSASLICYPFYYFFYVILAMLLYGLFFDCPSMIMYEKHHGCPCVQFVTKRIQAYFSK